MKKLAPAEKKQLKELAGRVKQLQKELVTAKQVEGIDSYLGVRVGGTKLRFSRTKVEDGPDKAVGEFRFILELTAKQTPLYIPLSIASGKTVAGFMYQIEGTGESSVASASVGVRTRGLTQISVGTLKYLVVPGGKAAEVVLVVTVRGKVGRTYRIVVNRLNYKLATADPRYQQYLKPLGSKSMRLFKHMIYKKQLEKQYSTIQTATLQFRSRLNALGRLISRIEEDEAFRAFDYVSYSELITEATEFRLLYTKNLYVFTQATLLLQEALTEDIERTSAYYQELRTFGKNTITVGQKLIAEVTEYVELVVESHALYTEFRLS